jgi:hypothetical protein
MVSIPSIRKFTFVDKFLVVTPPPPLINTLKEHLVCGLESRYNPIIFLERLRETTKSETG